MSAVKRVFTHSAIRSAIRKPFVPNDDGYREYLKRSVFELNGTQWGKLSEPVVLNGDFEIEWIGVPTVADTHLFADSGGSSRVIYTSTTEDVRINNAGIVNRFEAGIVRGSINTLSLKRTSGTYSLVVNNEVKNHSFEESDSTPFIIDSVCQKYGAATSISLFEGQIFNLKIWTNGDRGNGDLILNIPFDESGTDYQRNHAVALGSELVTNGDFGGGLTDWTTTAVTDSAEIIDGKLRMTYSGAQQICQQIIPTEIGKNYLLKLSISDLSSTWGLQVGDLSIGSQTVFGDLEFLFTGTENNLIQLKKGGVPVTSACFDNVSIREWSGVILQYALPEDWMQIEKKRYWNYWLNLFWPNLVSYSEDLTGSNWSKIRCSVTNSSGINELTTTGDDAYIYADCLPVDGVSTYTTSWRIRGVAGTVISLYLMRDGFLEPRQSSGLVLNGEWQDFEFTYTFTEEPTTTVRCRFDPAQAGTGGVIGDVYEISRAALYPDAENNYKTTNGAAGKKLEVAQ